MKEVFICSAIRTPLGSFGGALSAVPATKLGATAIQGALQKAGIAPELIQEVFMGNVCSANLGQAPARQAALYAGLSNTTVCTTINKVCSSAAKAIMFGAQSIMLGINDLVVAGGMENMSMVPYYIPKARFGYKYGNAELIDGLDKDGLKDVYQQASMGTFADITAKKYEISREAQDAYAIRSYKNAERATQSGIFADEITPVEVPQPKGNTVIVKEDEEYKNVKFDKIPSLKPAFTKDGTVTAANASTINDGAAAVVLASEQKIKELGLSPIAKIISFADAEHEPEWFTTAPCDAAPKALKAGGLSKNDIDFFEVNEAFSVVPLVFNKMLEADPEKINVHGGAVALGHPLG
ncbi:MAG TPA: acetyl-CoA C-acyltransferase, partial [Segetibacter sp.]|nr:acetyl-CoA C-acyltransferase [Segetibacter sp.]